MTDFELPNCLFSCLEVAEIALVASENARDINPYRFYSATSGYIYQLN